MSTDRLSGVAVEPGTVAPAAPDAATPPTPTLRAAREGQHVVILSGLSGGGKTAAAKLFEDLGYTVVDNLPGELLHRARGARLRRAGAVRQGRDRARRPVRRRADGVRGDARRARGARDPAAGVLPRGSRRGPDPALLGDAPPPPARRTSAGSPARSPRSAACSTPSGARPTSSSTPRTCRSASCASGSSPGSASRADPNRLAIQLISFGFKYGVPLEADLVFDVRFMQNPYYIAELRQLSGLTDAVRDVRPRPAGRPGVPPLPPRVPVVRPAGLRRRGQDPADDRARLHRRLPPLDRPRRGAGRVAPRAGLRAGGGLPSRAGPGLMAGGRAIRAPTTGRGVSPGSAAR